MSGGCSPAALRAGGGRLAELRERLAAENAAAGAPGAEAPAAEHASAPAGKKLAKLPKPKWLKVQGAGGENYERLRSTVRDLKLATALSGMLTRPGCELLFQPHVLDGRRAKASRGLSDSG